jgi:electron transfer flavoprotein-quinone oxidoreductase
LIESRFRLNEHEGSAWLFSGHLCGDNPAGGFLYTNRQSLSLGIVAPLTSVREGPVAASNLLSRFKHSSRGTSFIAGAETR